MELRDVVALITGGASGMGEATAKHIVAQGGKAVLLDLNEDKGNALIAAYDGQMVLVKTDVTDEVSVQQAVNKAIEVFGQVNVVVNCAGIAPPAKVLSRKGVHSLAQFDTVLRINLLGTFNVIRLAVEAMQHNKADVDGQRGVVINTASVAAFDGQIGQAAYSASKGGVVAMTLPLARELAEHGIRVLTIAPGLIETPMFAGLPEPAQEALAQMTPFPKRLGKPSEYALLVEMMIRNTLLNGEVIRLDGAIRMQPK
ncbi:3-hydroxyacyl-CoA dehydrogenase [Lysinibacillus piscis]|uniref:3-hydroxyacyl-CoA dehydrogenase n=1 Tax=Lysinibacillus piscis TaxID=2518931 RepID=A0ABQ5NJA7_9BACI|nr:3-hydroxyacyl-CoA dehydrogenase [Lysinibacillus sp. KH24]GLC88382.1 3-hydroxyacyl-CoA dehydrogenase [Lysinibacillus sp. KH24]